MCPFLFLPHFLTLSLSLSLLLKLKMSMGRGASERGKWEEGRVTEKETFLINLGLLCSFIRSCPKPNQLGPLCLFVSPHRTIFLFFSLSSLLFGFLPLSVHSLGFFFFVFFTIITTRNVHVLTLLYDYYFMNRVRKKREKRTRSNEKNLEEKGSERKGRQWRVRREAESCPIHLVLSFLSSFRDSQSITFLLSSLLLFLSLPSLISFFSFSSIFREFFLPVRASIVNLRCVYRGRFKMEDPVSIHCNNFPFRFLPPLFLSRFFDQKIEFCSLLELISPLVLLPLFSFYPRSSIVDGMSK